MGMDSDAVRLVRVETALDAHMRHCDERAERTADDIKAMRESMHSIRNTMQSGTQRIHERIEAGNATIAALQGDFTAMKETVSGVKAAAESGARAAVSSVKVWLYAQAAGMLGFIIVAVIALLQIREGK
jgi:hypothetical protein